MTEVEHPVWYNDGIECIDYIQSHKMNFCQGNMIKYATRYLKKGTPIADLQKIIQYANFEIKRLQCVERLEARGNGNAV